MCKHIPSLPPPPPPPPPPPLPPPSPHSCYEGLLFEGNTKDRSWTLVCQNNVTMTINPPGGVAKPMAWKIVATQKDEIVRSDSNTITSLFHFNRYGNVTLDLDSDTE